jgi:polysaccharide export outer membrane protein
MEFNSYFKARKNVRQFLLGLCVLLCVCIALEAQSNKKNLTAPSPETKPEGGEYVIGLEDVLSISVWKEPDLSLKEVVVRPYGKISLPLVNDIQANGLTPRRLQDEITGKLKEFIASPTVTVTVLRVVSQSVSIVGLVSRPGTYPLGAPITVAELLARAGGLTEYAKAKSIKVIRLENGKTLQFPVNYNEIIQGKNLQQNIILKKGDVVMVP